MWKNHYIVKNLIYFLVPLLIPILLLGSLSILITQHYVKEDVNQKNQSLLSQSRDNLELILNEMDTLSLNYQTNQSISVRLKSILNSPTLTYDQTLALDLISNFLGAPANARPYIHSIYVYYDNPYGKVLTSSEGLTVLNTFYDKSWLNSFYAPQDTDSWLEERQINQYGIESTRVISIFRKLYAAGSPKPSGVIVLNLYPKFIESQLQELLLSLEQTILIMDHRHGVLLQAGAAGRLNRSDLQKVTDAAGNSSIRLHDGTYTLSRLDSNRHGLYIVSLIPQNVLYRIPSRLFQITSLLLLASLMLGVYITYWLTRRNYESLKYIVSIIKSAEQGKKLPEPPPKVKDEYGFILHNLIQTFVEQSYLKTQLSERNYKLRFMEMLALQSQINPHFLYNTLEIINWKTLALTGRPNEASLMLEHLSDILKYVLSNPEQTVLLEKEIGYADIYLEIQKIRNRQKFQVIWDVEEKTRSRFVLKLILQPLLENAIDHGIKEKQGSGSLKIRIRSVSSGTRIHVIDNGAGISRDKMDWINRELGRNDDAQHPGEAGGRAHIGLFNTNKRLTLSYGREYGLRILSKPGWGTSVQVTIPAPAPGQDYSGFL
ncbi:MAG: integral rane sensor signal transduction histidine kinase [Paenibacillaceae bacterium]|nr:integral rane sensor signal transduction histidine kinase [Paenibacillaceae bacterium]